MKCHFRLLQLARLLLLLSGFGIIHTASASTSPYLPKSYQSTTGTTHAPAHKGLFASRHTAKPTPPVERCSDYPTFSALAVNGTFSVKITALPGKQTVRMIGSPEALARVSATVVGDTLTLKMVPRTDVPAPANPWVSVSVNMPRPLRGLALSGSAEVHGQGLRSPGLWVVAQDQSSLRLSGDITLTQVEDNSCGYVEIGKIHANYVQVLGAGPGNLRLSGSTNVLTARLFNQIHLIAMGLSAQKVYVTTQDQALAEVYPIQALYAFAKDASSIYYYHRPPFLVNSVHDAANVLYVGPNCPACFAK